VKYNIYAYDNSLSSGNANADVSITITDRTNLAGDLNNDLVRDLQDVPRLALAYANPQAYLATPEAAGVNGGTFGQRAGSNVTVPGATALDQQGIAGLVLLTDLNSNGNLTSAVGASSLIAVERDDVKYFLYGAAVDTSGFNSAGTTTLNGQVINLTAAQNRRENGVRLGQLKKNAAIDTFNTTLDGFVGTVNNPGTGTFYTQTEIDALKFNKFDVNGDNLVTRADAIVVDRNVGRDYTSLEDVLGTADDLIAAELNDNNLITHVDPDGPARGPLTSDFQLMRAELGTRLLDGDADINGIVDVADLGILASNWQINVDRWSLADFDFNGLVDVADLGLLASNWQQSASGVSLGEALAAVGLGGTAVPEPVCAGLLGVALLGLRRRK
jgi:hypothetical protein